MTTEMIFQGNFEPGRIYNTGDFAYFPDDNKSRVFDGYGWIEPLEMTSLQMPSPLSPQEILRLRSILQEKFPEDYI